MRESFLLNSLQNLLGWMDVLIGLGAAAFAASYFGRSRWAGVVAIAFALGVLNLVGSRILMPWAIRNNPPDVQHRIAEVALVGAVVGFLMQATLIVGVIGLLTELRRAQRRREFGQEPPTGAA